mgnify:FL=1
MTWSSGDKRIIGHLTACFISYYCEAVITKALREKNILLKNTAAEKQMNPPRALTVVEALKELNEVRAVPVKVHDQIIWVRTDITGNAASALQAVGCRIPPKLLQVEKIANL